MPDRTVVMAGGGDLPSSPIGALPGPGPVLELSENGASIDGTPLPGATHAERAAHLAEWSASNAGPAPTTPDNGAANPAAQRAALYVAASADTDVQTVRTYVTKVAPSYALRLLVRMPQPPNDSRTHDAPADDPATRVLLEQDPEKRRLVAEHGYDELAQCPAVSSAVLSVRSLGPRERWPALKAAIGGALPQCDCAKVDTVHLQSLVAAEQQGGAGAVGFVPLSFLRDEACGASMPLRSMRKLITQIERFDAEFAGSWQKDALSFGDVVTDDRLRVYFCDALPGETLAVKERARATIYMKPPGSTVCEAWKFDPLAPGSPMGTLRRAAGPSHGALAFHYWQAAEDVRVFGPVDPASPSKPTDSREWACEQTHHLTAMDDGHLQLDSGRWFLDDAACRKDTDDASHAFPCTSAPKPADPAGSIPSPVPSSGH
jgi:hypothetical protein